MRILEQHREALRKSPHRENRVVSTTVKVRALSFMNLVQNVVHQHCMHTWYMTIIFTLRFRRFLLVYQNKEDIVPANPHLPPPLRCKTVISQKLIFRSRIFFSYVEFTPCTKDGNVIVLYTCFFV